MHNIVLFIAVMLLTFLFLREASATDVELPQDPDNVCHLTNSCKAMGDIANPFEENDDELR